MFTIRQLIAQGIDIDKPLYVRRGDSAHGIIAFTRCSDGVEFTADFSAANQPVPPSQVEPAGGYTIQFEMSDEGKFRVVTLEVAQEGWRSVFDIVEADTLDQLTEHFSQLGDMVDCDEGHPGAEPFGNGFSVRGNLHKAIEIWVLRNASEVVSDIGLQDALKMAVAQREQEGFCLSCGHQQGFEQEFKACEECGSNRVVAADTIARLRGVNS